ncbi:MAG: EamA family transporter, partial [Planctomycetes bacterium]|nr:EamA family transporter [Planctomycetota bacterium]
TPVRAQGAVAYPVLATLFAAVGFMLYMSALDGGEASLVVSLTALYPGITILLAVLFLKERLAPINLVGIALALVAGVLICYSPAKKPAAAAPPPEAEAGAAPAAGAGAGLDARPQPAVEAGR